MGVMESSFIEDTMYQELCGLHATPYNVHEAFVKIKHAVEQKYPHISFTIINCEPYDICYSVDNKQDNSWCTHSTTVFELFNYLDVVHKRKEKQNGKK